MRKGNCPSGGAERARPGAIFFDAGGTLIEPVEPVGMIYATIAADYGIEADPLNLQERFQRLFPLQPKLAFAPDLPFEETVRCETEWWRRLVREVFAEEGSFPLFDEFFEILYRLFETTEAWRLIDGVDSTLSALSDHGFILGVVSNFDTRLFSILKEFGLLDRFSVVHVSTMWGAAKPDPEIFRTTLQVMGLAPEAVVHVGDSWREDVEGPLAAGMRAILLDRHSRFTDNSLLADDRIRRIDRIDRLTEPELLRFSSSLSRT